MEDNNKTLVEFKDVCKTFNEGKTVVMDHFNFEFLQGEIDLLDNRAAKEKKRRAAKKAEGDDLRDAVKNSIGADPITAGEIAEALAEDFPEVTKAKVTYRATQLVKDGIIYKVQLKTEDGKKVVAYTTEEPEDEE